MNLSVTALVRYLKGKLDSDSLIQNVCVEGEISNFRRHQSGHLYFTLKDEASQISCVMFRSSASTLSFLPKEGDKVLVKANTSLFETSGALQLYVRAMKPYGLGELYARYEQLKNRLSQEGYFASEHKIQKPEYPLNIAVLVGDKSAAMSDIVTCFKRRWPYAKVDYVPVPVQGNGAAAEIVQHLLVVDSRGYDAIILARGGGSFEDLFCFNDETLVKTIYNLKTFIITGIGHEQDYSLSDYAADLRAPTPTAAVELLTPNKADVLSELKDSVAFMNRAMKRKLDTTALRLQSSLQKPIFAQPLRILEKPSLRLEYNQSRLYKTKSRFAVLSVTIERQIDTMEYLLKQHIRRFADFLRLKNDNLKLSIQRKEEYEKLRIKRLSALVNAYSHEKILNQGYALVYKQDKLIKGPEEIDLNDLLKLQFAKGNLLVEVKEKSNG